MEVNGASKKNNLAKFAIITMGSHCNPWVLKLKKLRDKTGKFVESSPFGKKVISCRLYKTDQENFLNQSQELGLTPAELARLAIKEWLEFKSISKEEG